MVSTQQPVHTDVYLAHILALQVVHQDMLNPAVTEIHLVHAMTNTLPSKITVIFVDAVSYIK